jgi:putative FmdB family regulatory protein
MPIYEYECASCRKVVEVFQRMTEDPLTTCPNCSGPVKKLVSVSSFQLKGGGWYADGYSSASCNSSSAAAPAKADNKPSEKTEQPPKSSDKTPATVKGKESCTAST